MKVKELKPLLKLAKEMNLKVIRIGEFTAEFFPDQPDVTVPETIAMESLKVPSENDFRFYSAPSDEQEVGAQ